MITCYECENEIDEDDVEYECPFCGIDDSGEGFYICENCEALIDYCGDEWECEYCHNKGITQRRCIDYDEEECYYDDEYCEDGIPDVNQGWVGEHYG